MNGSPLLVSSPEDRQQRSFTGGSRQSLRLGSPSRNRYSLQFLPLHTQKAQSYLHLVVLKSEFIYNSVFQLYASAPRGQGTDHCKIFAGAEDSGCRVPGGEPHDFTQTRPLFSATAHPSCSKSSSSLWQLNKNWLNEKSETGLCFPWEKFED